MITEIKNINEDSLKEAKEILLNHGLVGMPTETVYGLAAIGTDPIAVREIYNVKGRPIDNPLIAHIHKDYDINKLVYIDNDYVYDLIKKFMPGPLTLVLRSKYFVCKEAVCGGDTLAVRMPSHEGCQRFLAYVDEPIVAPSANISKHTSPVTAEHVFNDLNGKIPLILDGGKSAGGIESTVLDVTEKTPRILRAGLITKEMITEVVGSCEIAQHKEGDKVKSPGVKYRHYRPKCDTALFEKDEEDKAFSLYFEQEKAGKKPYLMCENSLIERAKKVGITNFLDLGKDDREIASNLYYRLLEGEKKADIIIAVAFGREDGIYLGIMNRLRKSCG